VSTPHHPTCPDNAYADGLHTRFSFLFSLVVSLSLMA
jgi:hypothetical protein